MDDADFPFRKALGEAVLLFPVDESIAQKLNLLEKEYQFINNHSLNYFLSRYFLCVGI